MHCIALRTYVDWVEDAKCTTVKMHKLSKKLSGRFLEHLLCIRRGSFFLLLLFYNEIMPKNCTPFGKISCIYIWLWSPHQINNNKWISCPYCTREFYALVLFSEPISYSLPAIIPSWAATLFHHTFIVIVRAPICQLRASSGAVVFRLLFIFCASDCMRRF